MSDGPYLYQADLDALVRLEELIVNRDVEDALGRTHRRSLVELYGTNNMGAYINNAGQVAARALVIVTDPVTGSSTHYWEGCRLSPDPLLPLHPDGWESYGYESLGAIEPVAINDDGVVAGWDGWTVVVSRTPGSLDTIGNFKSDGTRPSAISNANSDFSTTITRPG